MTGDYATPLIRHAAPLKFVVCSKDSEKIIYYTSGKEI